MPLRRVTSRSKFYQHGDLSIFPRGIDGPLTLYTASNKAVTKLRHSLTASSKYIVLEDASAFVESGLIKITNPNNPTADSEVVFYGKKIGNQLHDLQRGYSNDTQYAWPAGSIITCPVMAEHHNALKDAIIKIQRKIGLVNNPDVESIHAMIRSLEQRALAPKASFRAFPLSGPAGTPVKFQNLSGGHNVRFLWDFGDGSTSTEKSPLHVYTNDGEYSVKLTVAASTGAQGFTEKANYISIKDEQRVPFFYVKPMQGYALDTHYRANTETVFTFIDQTDGDIVERHWFFGDNTEETVTNPNIHVVKHIYKTAGTYRPSLLIRYKDNLINKAVLSEGILVI